MVTINFTLILQLLLFLGFLWLMDRLVFKPLLALMDQRQADIDANKQSAISLVQEADNAESQFATQLGQVHRLTSQQFTHALFKASEENSAEIAALRKKGEEEIAQLHAQYNEAIKADRAAYPELAQGIAKLMSAKLGLE